MVKVNSQIGKTRSLAIPMSGISGNSQRMPDSLGLRKKRPWHIRHEVNTIVKGEWGGQTQKSVALSTENISNMIPQDPPFINSTNISQAPTVYQALYQKPWVQQRIKRYKIPDQLWLLIKTKVPLRPTLRSLDLLFELGCVQGWKLAAIPWGPVGLSEVMYKPK